MLISAHLTKKGWRGSPTPPVICVTIGTTTFYTMEGILIRVIGKDCDLILNSTRASKAFPEADKVPRETLSVLNKAAVRLIGQEAYTEINRIIDKELE